MWSVRILSGPQAGQVFDLKLGKNIFGRSTHCDVKILSVGISKEHCEIHVYKDKAMIVDLKSSNGTFVNGVKIQHSIIKLGDKFSLFDVIMDVIPAPDLRPKSSPPVFTPPPRVENPPVAFSHGATARQMVTATAPNQNFPQVQMQQNAEIYNLNVQTTPAAESQASQISFKEKMEYYIEDVFMGAIYKTAGVLPFKQVLLGFVLILIFTVTLLSLIPLTTITQESNYQEASKRAKSVARALARQNESALASDQFSNLTISEALKEDGITEALIVNQSDGSIVAPTEIAGRESAKPMISQIRKEQRAMVSRIDSNTIGASHPIGTYDLATGETKVKFHAVVYYDVSSLGVDEGRTISLFMQTLVIAAIIGGIVFFIFSRLIQYPLTTLNKQIDMALRERTDRVEVFFDYPVFQHLIANINLILNRLVNNSNDLSSLQPRQNRDLELSHIVDMLNQPGAVLNQSGIVIAVNEQFAQIAQMDKSSLLQQNYNTMTDVSLMQNIESLISRSLAAPYEKHFDRIPFSQFECEISIQACLGAGDQPEYYFIVLKKVEAV